MSRAAERIRAQLRALLDKTVANGCTENEALAAAAKAAELLAKHGLAEADITMDDERGEQPCGGEGWRMSLVATIGGCTNCATVLCRDGWHFIGLTPAPQIAAYLRTVTFRAVDAETERFKQGALYRARRKTATRRAAAADFRSGMIESLEHRLLAMYRATRDPHALAQAKAALAQRYPNTRTVSAPPRDVRFDDAASQGHRAGRAVALHHGVAGTTASPKLLGSS